MEAYLETGLQNTRVIGEELKVISHLSSGISNVYTSHSSRLENLEQCSPHFIQFYMHLFKCQVGLLLSEKISNLWSHLAKHIIPHFNHGIGRRGYH